MQTVHRLTRSQKGVKRSWYFINVYTKAEADELGLEYTYWRDCTNDMPQKWVLSDDGLVAEFIRVFDYTSSKRPKNILRGVQTMAGCANFAWKKPFSIQECIDYRSFTALSRTTWQQKMLRSGKGRTFIKKYVRLASKTRSVTPTGEDIVRLISEIFPDKKKPLSYMKYLLKQEEVRMAIKAEFESVYNENGIDVQYALNILKNAVDIASQKKDSKSLIAAFGQLKEILDMVPKEPKASQIQIPQADDLTFLQDAMQGALSPPTQPTSILAPMIEAQTHEFAEVLSETNA